MEGGIDTTGHLNLEDQSLPSVTPRAPGANFVPCDATVQEWDVSEELRNLSRTKRHYTEIPHGSCKDEVQLGFTKEWPRLKSHWHAGQLLSPRLQLRLASSSSFFSLNIYSFIEERRGRQRWKHQQ